MNLNTLLRAWEQRVPKWNRAGGIHFRRNAEKVGIFKAFKPDLKTPTFIIPTAKSSRFATGFKACRQSLHAESYFSLGSKIAKVL
ncbi:MAG: hypothetical protein AB7E42_02045 [Anaerotignaceae bacterium]